MESTVDVDALDEAIGAADVELDVEGDEHATASVPNAAKPIRSLRMQ